MTRYVMRRLLLAIPVLLGIMTAVFIMIQLIPGDPATAMAGDKGSVEQVARIREELGLNRSLPVQYAYFLKAAFTLNFGDSIRTNQPVAAELRAAAAVRRNSVRPGCSADRLGRARETIAQIDPAEHAGHQADVPRKHDRAPVRADRRQDRRRRRLCSALV